MKDTHRLIVQHLDAARRVARKVARFVDDPDLRQDVESAAMVGLTEAAERYDATHEEPFFAFAVKRVRGAALDELRRADRLPRRERARAKRLAAAIATVEARTGGRANDNDIADEIGVTVGEIESARARMQAAGRVPFDRCHEHALASPDASPETLTEQARQCSAITRGLRALAERDRSILALSYGRDLSLREIGEVLGVSESRVCQLRTRAVATLRAHVLSARRPSNDQDAPPPIASCAVAGY